MARELDIRITVDTQVAKQKLADVDKALDHVGTTATSTTASLTASDNSFVKMAASYAAGLVTVVALKAGFELLSAVVRGSIASFAAQEAATSKLNAALRNNGQYTPELSKQYQTLSSQLERTSVYSDELTQEMTALLVQVGNVMPAQMKGALKASMDLASGLGIDLRTATLLVGKAFEGETGTLKRYGIVIDENTLKTQGATAVLDAIQAKFGGQAQAEAETYTGKVQQLGNAWDNVKESLGGAILNYPIVQAALRTLTDEATEHEHTVSSVSVAWDNFWTMAAAGDPTKTIQHLQEMNVALAEQEAYLGAIARLKANAPDLTSKSNLIGAGPVTGVLGMSWFAAKVKADTDAAPEAKRIADEAQRQAREYAEAVRGLDGRVIALNVDLALMGKNLHLINHESAVASTGPSALIPTLTGTRTFAQGTTAINAGTMFARQQLTTGPAALAGQVPAQTSSLMDNLASAVPGSILAAIQGGGSKMQAAGSAIGLSLFGKDSTATKAISGGLSALFGPNSFMTKTLGQAVPVIGALIGPAIEGLGALFKKVFGTAGRDAVRDFAGSQGGFDALHQKLAGLGTDGEALWKSLTQGVGRNNPEQAKKEIEKVTAAFAAFEQTVKDARGALTQTETKLQHITAITPEVKAGLQDALNAKTPQDFLAALTNVNGQLDATAQKHQHLKDLADKYNISAKGMGQAFAQGEVDLKAQALIEDTKDLTEAGADATEMLKGMAGKYSELVQAAKDSGSEIPASMRPTLDKLIGMGELVDENGDKLKNLDGLKFGDSLEQRLKDIKDVVNDLRGAIDNLANAFRGLPTNLPALPSPQRDTREPDTGGPVEASRGGILDRTGHLTTFAPQYYSSGNLIAFRPKGSDRYPAMIGRDETVRTSGQEGRLERLLQQLVNMARRQPEQNAIYTRDALVKALRRA